MKRPPKQTTIAAMEGLKRERRRSLNPIRLLKPDYLARALDSFAYGDLRDAALLWEAMAERDDVLASVKPKREKSIAHKPWDILTLDDTPEARRHKAALEFFYNNLTAVNAYDRNEQGGFRRLVRQMMTSVSYRYACHHLIWQPSAEGITATFEFCPLWFFENREGVLKFVPDGFGLEGEEMADGEWMVTVGDGLMIPCSIGFWAKRLAFQDWLTFSEKFGLPGVLGRTSAAQDSEAGEAMKSAVEAFGNDWAAVIYGDDGSGRIDLVETKSGAANSLPMPALIDRIDRKFAALYRGADLSTISSGQDSEGRGASLQGGETDVLEQDDADEISETLQNSVERFVARYWFGKDRLRAYLQISVPEAEDKKLVLELAERLTDRGAKIGLDGLLERVGFAPGGTEEEALGRKAVPMGIQDREKPDAGSASQGGEDGPPEASTNARMGLAGVLTPGAGQKPRCSPCNGAAAMSRRERDLDELLRRSNVLLGEAFEPVITPVLEEIDALLNAPDDEFPDRLNQLRRSSLELVYKRTQSDGLANAFWEVLSSALFSGLASGQEATDHALKKTS